MHEGKEHQLLLWMCRFPLRPSPSTCRQSKHCAAQYQGIQLMPDKENGAGILGRRQSGSCTRGLFSQVVQPEISQDTEAMKCQRCQRDILESDISKFIPSFPHSYPCNGTLIPMFVQWWFSPYRKGKRYQIFVRISCQTSRCLSWLLTEQDTHKPLVASSIPIAVT